MNRYDIKNKRTSVITHSYKDVVQRAHLSEWGQLERLKWQDECTEQEKSDAIEIIQVVIKPEIPAIPEVTRKEYLVDDVWTDEDELTPEQIASATNERIIVVVPGVPERPAVTRLRCKLPQTYEVIVTDITSELQAEDNRKVQIRTLKDRLLVLDGQPDLTAAELKEYARKLGKYIFLTKKLD